LEIWDLDLEWMMMTFSKILEEQEGKKNKIAIKGNKILWTPS
jgi:hypothetical protein